MFRRFSGHITSVFFMLARVATNSHLFLALTEVLSLFTVYGEALVPTRNEFFKKTFDFAR